MEEMISVKCSIVRGGTSKGIFIMENELPKDPESRDKYILEIFGSPDVRQINGLGGADVLTSKLAIIGRMRMWTTPLGRSALWTQRWIINQTAETYPREWAPMPLTTAW